METSKLLLGPTVSVNRGKVSEVGQEQTGLHQTCVRENRGFEDLMQAVWG